MTPKKTPAKIDDADKTVDGVADKNQRWLNAGAASQTLDQHFPALVRRGVGGALNVSLLIKDSFRVACERSSSWSCPSHHKN